jgi:CspA family cold shock protein
VRDDVPTGKVKWYDADKGFGFLTRDDGGDVYVHNSVLPDGVTTLKGGTRVEFGVASGRRGEQALQVRLLDPLPSLAARDLRSPDELHGMIDDMIKVLEARVQPALRRGQRPDRQTAKKIAEVVHAVARELEP